MTWEDPSEEWNRARASWGSVKVSVDPGVDDKPMVIIGTGAGWNTSAALHQNHGERRWFTRESVPEYAFADELNRMIAARWRR